MTHPQWLVDYFDDVDNRRLEPFVARHTPDITMRFGNAPVMAGHAQLRDGIGEFWGSIEALRHRFGQTWQVDHRTTVFEHAIDYTRKDGGQVNIPCTVIFERDGELVSGIRSYIDLGPVFA